MSRRPGVLVAFAVAALCLLEASQAAGAEPSAGPDPPAPFATRSLFILHLPILDFGPVQPYPLAPGGVVLSASAEWATSYSTTWHARRFHAAPANFGKPFSQAEADAIHTVYPQDEVLFVDGEILREALHGRYGVTPSLSVSIELSYITHGISGLENFVVAFHRATGADQNGRNEFPSGRFTVMLQTPGGPMRFLTYEPVSGLGDLTAALSWRRPRSSGGWSFGADLAVKAPTGSAADFNGSGGWDGGLLGFAVRQWGRWTLELDGSIVVPGRWKAPIPLKTSAVGRLLLSAVYSSNARTRAGMSVTAARSPFNGENDSTISKVGIEFGLGVERDVSRRVAARLTLVEHFPSAATGDRSDFGFALGLRYR